MIRLNCKTNRKSITFNQIDSSLIKKYGFCWCGLDLYADGDTIFIFGKGQGTITSARVSFVGRGQKVNAVIQNNNIVSAICSRFNIEETGDYLLHIRFGMLTDDGLSFTIDGIFDIVVNTRKCTNCGRELSESQFYRRGNKLQSWCIDCQKQHGRLRNGTTGEYRNDPTVSQATDQQLWDELKRRGYEGEVTKHMK